MMSQDLSKDIQKIEASTFEDHDTAVLPPPDVIAYNELRSCADLFRMYKEGILEIRPHFQRQIVWPDAAQTRFIDSLIKELPIPSMCFSMDYTQQRWQVVDGLQRMWSIIRFLSGDDWRLSALEDIDRSLAGSYVPDFANGDPKLGSFFSRIRNLTLPVTVIRCDYSKNNHMEYLFTIFHRLNSGGTRLTNQEIRNCIYSGKFNSFLQQLDLDDKWQRINGIKSGQSDRYRGQELILRFFAFHDTRDNYKGGLAKFLNTYMNEHREPNDLYLKSKERIFRQTIKIVEESIHRQNPDWRGSISVLEATLVGVSLNLQYLRQLEPTVINKMYQTMIGSREFSEEQLREGLSGRARVRDRMSAAIEIFGGARNGQ